MEPLRTSFRVIISNVADDTPPAVRDARTPRTVELLGPLQGGFRNISNDSTKRPGTLRRESFRSRTVTAESVSGGPPSQAVRTRPIVSRIAHWPSLTIYSGLR